MSYRRVAWITPRASEVPDSLLAIAELYTEMGDRFGRSYYQSAADSYQFLVREYPTSKYCQDAILRIAKLQRDQLGDSALAKKTYQDFLKRYWRSCRAATRHPQRTAWRQIQRRPCQPRKRRARMRRCTLGASRLAGQDRGRFRGCGGFARTPRAKRRV